MYSVLDSSNCSKYSSCVRTTHTRLFITTYHCIHTVQALLCNDYDFKTVKLHPAKRLCSHSNALSEYWSTRMG
jgi:hypothetical protein